MPGVVPPRAQRRNEDYPWDQFDTQAYLAHNYKHVRHDDRRILRIVSRFFERACQGKRDLRGIDVGTGANLYPALAMLPFCQEITLLEFAQSNVDWLRSERENMWPSWLGSWGGFWQILRRMPSYRAFTEPERWLAKRAEVVHRSLFELPRDNSYDIGTMFFVAESITRQRAEFSAAMDHFLDSLGRDAPFAIALMEHSRGYQVGDSYFPATDISTRDVEQFLRGRVRRVEVKRIGPGADPVRDGYTGMIVAYGRARGCQLGTGDDRANSTAAADAGSVAGGSQILSAGQEKDLVMGRPGAA